MRRVTPLGNLLFLLLSVSSLFADESHLRICFWNVESGGASRNVNAERIKNEDGVDIWGLSEVKNASDAAKYLLASKDGESGEFKSILGTTGGQDKLLILYNDEKLELVEFSELHEINIGGSVRAPLVARFKLREGESEFLFMVNHLYRSNTTARHTQAMKINNWAEAQSLPAIVGGDMNFDWHHQNGDTDHDSGYDFVVEDGVFSWVRPEVLVPTNSSTHKSVLDFVFVSGDAITWPAESTILVKPGDFPDGALRSDHRPVDCVFSIPESLEPVTPSLLTMVEAEAMLESKSALDGDLSSGRRSALSSGEANEEAELLMRIEALERELSRVKSLLNPNP